MHTPLICFQYTSEVCGLVFGKGGFLSTGCMAALQAEHFLTENEIVSPQANGGAEPYLNGKAF